MTLWRLKLRVKNRTSLGPRMSHEVEQRQPVGSLSPLTSCLVWLLLSSSLVPLYFTGACLTLRLHPSSRLPRQFLFVVAFTTFLVSCVDYDILFANKMVNHSLHPTEPVKVTLPDAFLPAQVCSAR